MSRLGRPGLVESGYPGSTGRPALVRTIGPVLKRSKKKSRENPSGEQVDNPFGKRFSLF